MTLAFVDPLSGVTVLIQSYQWGLMDGREYVAREFGTTPFGAWYRQGTEHQIRRLMVRFAAIDDVIDELQTLTMLAMRHGGPVQFYPDATLGAYIWVIWPQDVSLMRVIENREEVELVLQETGEPGVNPNPPIAGVALPAGTIMVGGYGDAGFAFLSPDGATLYPQPESAPVAGDGLIAMCRTSDGHIGQMGGTAGDFALSWTGLFNASDLTVIGEYNDSAHTYVNGELIAADASGHWYTGKVSGGNFRVARITAALTRVATWTIAQPVGYTSASMKALAVSGDGLTAYVWMALASGGDANHYRVHKYSLSGSGSYVGPLSTDWSTGPGYQSLVCVPGTSDVLVCFESINTTSVSTSAVRRYTASGTLVWTAGTPTGSVNWEWESVAIGGATDFVALAYTDDTTFSGCRYVWFDYATGTPDNTRNFAPDDGAGFVFNSQFAVLAVPVPV